MNDKYVKISLLLTGLLGMAVALPGTLGLYADTANEAFLNQVWGGCNGPCINVGGKCGWIANEQSCFGSYPDCDGSCGSNCGPGGNNQGCLGLFGDCEEDYVDCAPVERNKCVGHAGYCDCDPVGLAGWYCSRSDC